MPGPETAYVGYSLGALQKQVVTLAEKSVEVCHRSLCRSFTNI